jgi:hypothetical protein
VTSSAIPRHLDVGDGGRDILGVADALQRRRSRDLVVEVGAQARQGVWRSGWGSAVNVAKLRTAWDVFSSVGESYRRIDVPTQSKSDVLASRKFSPCQTTTELEDEDEFVLGSGFT